MSDKKVTFRPLMRKDGTSEFIDFLGNLPEKDEMKLVALIEKVEDKGLLVSQRQEWIKKIDDDLYELRSKVSSNIQRAFYFQKIGSEYLITHGFTKKTQETPKREINHAKELREKYKRGELL